MQTVTITTLESSFSSELYQELFDYFDIHEICQTFYDLNFHLNEIIRQSYIHLNLSSKYNEQHILPKIYLPSIRSLKLSNSHTNNQIISVLSQYSLENFINLYSLTLNDLQVNDIKYTIDKLQCLKRLSTLTIGFHRSIYNGIVKHILKIIFSDSLLYTLKYLKFYNCRWIIHSIVSTKTPSNIQHLNISLIHKTDFIHLIPLLPHLRSITIGLWNNQSSIIATKMILPIMTDLVKLNLFNCSGLSFEHTKSFFLLKLPNLKKISLKVYDLSYANGKEWEQLFINDLPKVNSFYLSVRLESQYINKNDLLSTFQTNYWIKYHVEIQNYSEAFSNSTQLIVKLRTV
ncbi:unnamed protein product [Didymodactylos carnosus]|uniref:Uncharacterized protein n=1 Tax=Didymodactylos carnosus TaxID=1234261 RepID=A0A8S2EM06_9BILA|nr:unnamed protein product [Didymodactylos carnosus]CAF3994283.1 unnamed protein product [Didymodactylos carnosus]